MQRCVANEELTHPNVIPAALIALDSFVSREDHHLGREYATRNVHLKSKGRSMTPPPQIQPR